MRAVQTGTRRDSGVRRGFQGATVLGRVFSRSSARHSPTARPEQQGRAPYGPGPAEVTAPARSRAPPDASPGAGGHSTAPASPAASPLSGTPGSAAGPPAA